MAGTLVHFAGAETGGLEEVETVSGGAAADSAQARSGSYSYKLSGNATVQAAVPDNSAEVNAGIAGFGFRWNVNLIPTSDIDFFRAGNAAGTALHLRLRIKAVTGDVKVVDATGTEVATITAPFAQNTWYYVEVYAPRSDSATAEVWINGTSVASVSGDFLNGAGGQTFGLWGSLVTGEDIWIDDFYKHNNPAA